MTCPRCTGAAYPHYHTPTEKWRVQCVACNLVVAKATKAKAVATFETATESQL